MLKFSLPASKHEDFNSFPLEYKEDQTIDTDKILKYPFQTAYKIQKYQGEQHGIEDVIPDSKVGVLKKKFQRPTFAFTPDTWEMDHLHGRPVQSGGKTLMVASYLVFINVNTKYLYLFPVQTKEANETFNVIKKFTELEFEHFGHKVKLIKCDGDAGFESAMQLIMTEQSKYENQMDYELVPDENYVPPQRRRGRRKKNEGMIQKLVPKKIDYHPLYGVSFHVSSSKFTFHNKIVDSVMRTLRNALGPNRQNYWDGEHDVLIQQLAYYYNNTWHKSIKMTPLEMHTQREKEWEFIRRKTEKLNEVKQRLYENGYYGFQPGDEVLVYLDTSKTKHRFNKRRRNFDHLSLFQRYEDGHAIVLVTFRKDDEINEGEDEILEGDVEVAVPIYFIKKI